MKRKKILIVDDDQSILEITKIILKDEGYDVVTLVGCPDIVGKVKRESPDLVLLDLWMPDISGEEMTYALRDNRSTKKIPILIFSASKDTKETAAKLGVDGYLLKPFDMDQLLLQVSELL